MNTKTVEVSDSAARKTGIVEGDKRDKTRKVVINFLAKHPKYGKYLSAHKKYLAHDEEGQAGIGDIVQISESRPLSKRKRWRLVEVVRKVTVTDGRPTEVDGGVL